LSSYLFFYYSDYKLYIYHLQNKMYTKVTQNEKGELLAWYPVETKYEGSELDCDVIQDYSVYPHETWAFIAEYTPAMHCFWSYKTQDEALEAVLKHIKEKEEMFKRIEEQKVKFEALQKANSLDERYKDHPNNNAPAVKKKVKTLWYLENLMQKAGARTKEMHMRVEEARMNRNWKLGNAEYINALIEH